MVAAVASYSSVAVASHATRMMLASQRLGQPAKTLFDRLFIKGESAASVQNDMGLTAAEFAQHNSSMLRTLMTASQ
jgi:hypothetical protein